MREVMITWIGNVASSPAWCDSRPLLERGAMLSDWPLVSHFGASRIPALRALPTICSRRRKEMSETSRRVAPMTPDSCLKIMTTTRLFYSWKTSLPNIFFKILCGYCGIALSTIQQFRNKISQFIVIFSFFFFFFFLRFKDSLEFLSSWMPSYKLKNKLENQIDVAFRRIIEFQLTEGNRLAKRSDSSSFPRRHGHRRIHRSHRFILWLAS